MSAPDADEPYLSPTWIFLPANAERSIDPEFTNVQLPAAGHVGMATGVQSDAPDSRTANPQRVVSVVWNLAACSNDAVADVTAVRSIVGRYRIRFGCIGYFIEIGAAVQIVVAVVFSPLPDVGEFCRHGDIVEGPVAFCR